MSVLRGMVFSGCGDYAQWITKYQEYYRAKTGLTLFPGTLNLRLPGPYESRSRRLMHGTGGCNRLPPRQALAWLLLRNVALRLMRQVTVPFCFS